MSKLGVKRFLVLALIMASAVACMCAINVLPSKINTWFDNQRVEEDYLDIGLDYKDGWYLINDAEDYYLMADLVNADMAQGAKFKIMNDITVDSRRASINNFSNATLEGNGYNINMELLPEYEPDINAMAVNLNGRDKSAGLKYTSPQSIIDGGDWSIYGVSVAACLASSGLGVTNGSGYMGTYDDSIVGSSRDTWIINAKKYSINNSATFNLAYSENSTEYTTLHHVNMGIAVGGVFGVVKDATVQNVYVTISKPIILGVGSTVNQWLILGGLVGVAYNSTIQYCVVDFVDSGDLNLQPCDDSGVADTQDDSGECEKSSNTSIGGLVGHAHGSTITKNVVIYKKDTTPNFSKYGYYTGLVGSNTNTKDGEGVVYTYLVDDQKASLHMDDQDYEFSSEVSIPAKTASNECWIMYKSDSSGNLINNGKIIQSCFVDSVAPTYITITANPNGGTISSLNGWTSSGTNATKKIEQGTKIGNLPVATLSGYEFAGWYTSKTGGSQVTENETFSSTTTIYAHWESSSITVTAHTNGSGTYSSIESLMYGWTRVDDYTATRVMEEGEKFNDFPYIKCYDARYTVSTIDGWNTKANGSGVTIGYSTLFDPSTMLDIYAQQKLRSFLITFDLQGGEVLSYYADNADGYNKEYYGGKSTELYFSKPANTAYYDAGETFTLPTATQTIRGNCVFKGWKISKVETLGINDSISTDWAMTVNEVDFEPGAQISKKHGAITLTAVWEECVITWDYNEEGIENWEQSYVYSDAIELPENTKDILGGMYISKWIVIVADGTWTEGAEYEAGTSKTNMWGHVTLQAVWEYIPYIIYLEVDDGEIYSAVIDYQPSGDIASYENYKITYNVKTEFALPKALNGDKVEISKPGYKFLGWQFKDTGEPHNIDFVYNEDSTYITRVNKGSYGDATLKAVWELVEYTMTLQLDADENTLAQLIAYTPVNSSTGDEISYELVDNSVTGGKNIVFTYNINYAFELPKAEEIKKAGYSFLGWNWINEDDLMNVIGSESNGYYTSISAGTYGDVVLLAIWEPNGYSITINGNGGTIDGNGSIKIEYSIEGMTSSVMLLSESQKVYLPSLDSWEYEGHVPLYYQLAGAEGEHNWGEIGTQYPSGADVTGKYGDVNLIVVWREIIYNIQLIKGTGDVTNIEGINYNDGITFPDIHNKETASVMVAGTSYDIDWASGLSRDKYIFIGWSVMSSLNHGEGMTYIQAGEYLAIDIVEGILQSGSVSQLTATDKVTVSIYAIWLPIYEVTVESSGAEIYDNGTKVTDKTYFIVTNNYREGYEIYSQEDRDLFYAPTRTGYGLHKFGYEITGWAVTVGGTRCYTSLPNPTLTDWLVDNEGKLVSSGTNLQYLQGNIVLTPNWAPVTLDVRVKTESSEGYKEGYNQVKVTPIVFDTDYAMSET
ncbi:MAG: InlB B-repeat-containing protein, partial [Clostridia bacterium]|nr:InlB B-repeat-containing protein [Clostridia bacterium]